VSRAGRGVRYAGALLAILSGGVVLAIGWLKWHANELVFATTAPLNTLLPLAQEAGNR
jgi:hypothetical protein